MTDLESILSDEPFEVYRDKSRHFLSSHALSDYRKSPLLYKKKKDGLIPEYDSNALFVGRAVHKYILEGKEAFDMEYIVGGPINEKTGKPYGKDTQKFTEWQAEQGKIVISDDDYARMIKMSIMVRKHPIASKLLAEGLAEKVLRVDIDVGKRELIPCQIRIDWINDDALIDLKTCRDIDDFHEDAEKYGYFNQLAFYYEVLRQAGVVRKPYIIATEKQEPYRCAVYEIDGESLMTAVDLNECAMREIIDSQRMDCWASGTEQIRILKHSVVVHTDAYEENDT